MIEKGGSKGGSAAKKPIGKTPPSSGKGKQQVISGFFVKKQPVESPAVPEPKGGDGSPNLGA